MNLNEYAGDYDIYQNHLSVENAEAYLEERSNYEEEIESLKSVLSDIDDIVNGEGYGTSKERIEQVKEVLNSVETYL